jgi:hypothetical protein
LLHSISSQKSNYNESIDILKKGNKFNLSEGSKLELQILEIITDIKLNDFANARKKLDKILKLKNIPQSIRLQADELSGMM